MHHTVGHGLHWLARALALIQKQSASFFYLSGWSLGITPRVVMRRWREAAGVRRSHSMLAGMDSAELSQPWKTLERLSNTLQPFPGDQNDVFHRALPENAALASAHRGLINDTKSFLQNPGSSTGNQEGPTAIYLSPLLPPLSSVPRGDNTGYRHHCVGWLWSKKREALAS